MPRIRDAAHADVAAITRIYADEVRHGAASYEYEAPDEAEIATRFATLRAAGYPYLVAELQGAVAGFAYASAYRTRAGYRWTVEDSVYIDANHRGRRIGSALLGALIERCESQGYRRMVAVIGDGSNRASVALHERAGFQVVGRFPGLGVKHGRWLENVQMMRILGDADAPPPDVSPLPDAG